MNKSKKSLAVSGLWLVAGAMALAAQAEITTNVMNFATSETITTNGLAAALLSATDYPIRAAEITKVKVTGGFWFDRLETNRMATLNSIWGNCRSRVANFENAGKRLIGKFAGRPYDDSDVYKLIEGTSYVLAAHPNAELESRVARVIGEIARAQEPDGYLFTARTLGYEKLKWSNPNEFYVRAMGQTRWSRPTSHELYNAGHLYEAAVAWHRATGRSDLLAVAERNASLVGRTFGPDEYQLKEVPGHPEIELALCKLFRETGKRRYLDLARHFIGLRGRQISISDDAMTFGTGGKLVPVGNVRIPQIIHLRHAPLADQRTAVGHAVCATYLYCGASDVAVLTGDSTWDGALSAIWRDVIDTKLQLSGGIGSTPGGERFDEPYKLPNNYRETYLETCAAIGNALWNERLFRRTGKSAAVDVLERTLYNGLISGVSLSGDEYFYPNPLASKGGYKRSKWFSCSCCPVNILRFLPQVPSFAYATDAKGTLYWNLFIQGEAEVGGWKFKVETDYPWSGKVKMTLLGSPSTFASLKLRIPGWAVGRPVPSDLYVQTAPSSFMEVLVEVNGRALNGCPGLDGYVAIGREWKTGDVVSLDIPMPVKRIRAHEKVEADRGRLAVERGPIVFCAEGVDNGGKAFDAVLPADATFTEEKIVIGDKTFPALRASNGLKLVPYFLWGNRKPGNEMQCWPKAEKGGKVES